MNSPYHFSPYFLQAAALKLMDTAQSQFEHAIALDLILSVTTAFSDSQALAAHNLWNLYMGEELRDALPALIVNAGFTQMWQVAHEIRSPLFYLQVLLGIKQQTSESSLFKQFGRLMEEAFVFLAQQVNDLDTYVKDRLRDMISYYISQLPDFRGDSLFQKLEEGGKVPESFIQDVFLQLIRMSFFKRVKENTDEKYHKYLPEADSSQSHLSFTYLASGTGDDIKAANPDADLIMDKLNSKEPADRIKEFLDSGDL